jgi:diacylglycerol kinase
MGLKKFLRSFYHAFRGIAECFKSERNFKIHAATAVTAVLFSFFFKIAAYEWMFIITAIAAVMSAEIINTAVEKIADFIEPDKNEKIRIIKDMTAGMVLIAAAGAFILGAVVFFPRVFGIFFNFF